MLLRDAKTFGKSGGFTLVELLIAVSLIAVLSGIILGVLDIPGTRKKTRDSQRIADLRKVQVALELYFSDVSRYPNPSPVCTGDGWCSISNLGVLVSDYIDVIPSDPSTNTYSYRTNAAGSIYALAAIMEVTSSNDTDMCSGLSSWSTLTSDGSTPAGYGEDLCYGVENQ